jgi:hypothetical protein
MRLAGTPNWPLILTQVSAMFAAADDANVTVRLGPDQDIVYVPGRRGEDCWLVEAVSNTYLGSHVQLTVVLWIVGRSGPVVIQLSSHHPRRYRRGRTQRPVAEPTCSVRGCS